MADRSLEEMLSAQNSNSPTPVADGLYGTNTPRVQRDRAQGTRLTDGPNVLSWDCGISNLCYCLVELVGDDKFRVIMWENMNLNSQTLKQTISALIKTLDKRPWMLDADFVCVEGQVLKNVQMKVVSHAIQCYFETQWAVRAAVAAERQQQDGVVATSAGGSGVRVVEDIHRGPTGGVHFVKAENKFKAVPVGMKLPDKIEKLLNRRTKNKRAAVYFATTMLQAIGDETALAFLQSFEKRDDLADALLQGVYFLGTQKTRIAQQKRLRNYLGQDQAAPRRVIQIDDRTGTKEEPYCDASDGVNEGCEYESEVALPQLYRNQSFVLPVYETGGVITPAIRFPRCK